MTEEVSLEMDVAFYVKKSQDGPVQGLQVLVLLFVPMESQWEVNNAMTIIQSILMDVQDVW